MILLIDHAKIRTALSLCASVVGKPSSSIPILANVLLRAEGDTLTLSATDLDMTAIVKLDCTTRENGAVTCELSALLDIAKNTDDPLTMATASNGRLEISTGTANYKLPTLPAEDFPTLPDVSDNQGSPGECGEIELSASELLPMLRTVSYGEGETDVRFQLAGALVNIMYGAVEIATTDGHRMAVCALPRKSRTEQGVFLPSRLVAASAKLSVTNEATDVVAEWNPCHVSLRLGATSLIALRPAAVGFPNYRESIPLSTTTILASTESLKSALRRAMAFSGERRRIRCAFRSGELGMSAESATRGDAADVAATDYTGDEILCGYNARYLSDALAAIHTTMTELSSSDIATCLMLKPVNSDLPFSALHVIMSMRIVP